MNRPSFILKSSCPDKVGIVAAVSGFLAERDALISEMSHFVDVDAQRSFVRVEFEDQSTVPKIQSVWSDQYQQEVSNRFDMQFELYRSEQKIRTLIAVSKQSHCLNALLHRWADGHLPIEVTGVVSNHDDQRSLVEWHNLPFYHFPIEAGKKPQQEAKILSLFEETRSELLVLARYMQILTPEACDFLTGRAINIHHSFLPGFKGARPYHQAFDRGVKLIGATAHYVSTDLDEGPIIEQGVERVNHSMNPKDLERLGQDVESSVLNRAVRWHAEHRVFANGNRTVLLNH